MLNIISLSVLIPEIAGPQQSLFMSFVVEGNFCQKTIEIDQPLSQIGLRTSSTSLMWFRIDWYVGELGPLNSLIVDMAICPSKVADDGRLLITVGDVG
jgi:hypothetical protein